MPTAQTKLSDGTPYPETIAILNDNIDKTVTDIGDLGAKFSSTGTVTATIAAGNSFSVTVTVTDPTAQYRPGSLQIVPRVEVFVDTNGDDTLLFPYGGSLSAGQKNGFLSCWIARRPNTGKVAQFVVQLQNLDASPHTYYFVVDESYISSPPQGNFR